MAFLIKDRVWENATGTGTGNLVLVSAVQNARRFQDAFSTSDATYYLIQDGSQWEIGVGTLTTLTTFTRDTVLINSLGNTTKISLSGQQVTVAGVIPASAMLFLDNNGSLGNPTAFRNAIVVDDIATLKAESLMANGERVFVAYQTTAADGKGGIFEWDSVDATAPDNIDTFRSNSFGTGLWKRVFLKINRPLFDDLFEVDATVATSEVRMFAAPKAANPNSWYGLKVVSNILELGARYLQGSYTSFMSLISLGTAADRIAFNKPVVLPSVASATSLVDGTAAIVGGDLEYTDNSTQYEMPTTKGHVRVWQLTNAALKALDAAAFFNDGDVAYSAGNTAKGDTGGALFEWVAASSASDDGVNTLRPTVGAAASGNGRWIRILSAVNSTFANSDATPSIKGGEVFFTADTAITNFDDPFDGKEITVIRGSTDGIITNNSNIVTGTGLDILMKANSANVVLLKYLASTSKWYVIATSTMLVGKSKSGVAIKRTTDLAIVTATLTVLPWESEVYDTDAAFDSVVDNTVITVPAGVTTCQIIGQIAWDAGSGGMRFIQFQKKQSGGGWAVADLLPYVKYNSVAGQVVQNFSSPELEVGVGDQFRILVYQDSGSNVSIDGTGASSTLTWLSIKWL